MKADKCDNRPIARAAATNSVAGAEFRANPWNEPDNPRRSQRWSPATHLDDPEFR